MISSIEMRISGRPNRSSILISRIDCFIIFPVDDLVDRWGDQNFDPLLRTVSDQALLLLLRIVIGGEKDRVDIDSVPQVFDAVLILEIVDRALRDRMLAQGLPVGQKTDDAVMRRVLKTRDQRHRLVPVP